LKKEMNLGIIGRLRRDFIETKRGKFVEVNIWGEGRADGKDYIIIGEAKTQLKKSDIDSFIRKAEEIKKFVPGEQVRILVTYIASPPVRKYAEEKGVKLYFSYEF
ncbi:chordopoxvirus fusion protein, partial [Candidatus Calescamantes bacterium]|nr:chordopoxvirus fusion protein [Candidatus Calescamantes bacterium]